jgi:hypothetical protein
MTTDGVTKPLKSYRRAAIIGGLAGLLLLAVYVVYEVLMTPAMPNLQTAAAQEVVSYIADRRGLTTLAQVEQQQFLQRWAEMLTQDAQKKEELRSFFEKIDDGLRKSFATEIFGNLKTAFLNDAKAYTTLPADGKFAYLRDKCGQYQQRAAFVKEVAVGFSRQFKGTEDDLREWLMEHTTAEERAVGEPYIEALKKVEEQLRKEQRTAGSAPVLAP